MLNAVSFSSNRNLHSFNDDLIKGIRSEDKIEYYLDEFAKTLSSFLPEHIEYLGYEYLDSIAQNRKVNSLKDSGAKGKEVVIHHSRTVSRLCNFNFKLTYNGDVMNKTMSLWIPQVVDGIRYFIRGNYYSAPFQIIDSLVFSKTSKMLVLKTLTRAIKIEKENKPISDIFGNNYMANVIKIILTKQPTPILLYFLSYFGFYDTISYFFKDNEIEFENKKIQLIKIVECNIDELAQFDDNEYIKFKFGLTFMIVNRAFFLADSSGVFRQFVATMLEIVKTKKIERMINIEFMEKIENWRYLLGYSSLSVSIQQQALTNKIIENGTSLLKTFITRYDFLTKKIANSIYPEYGLKNNMFSLMRFLFYRFNVLAAQDNGLQNKRFRIAEYLIHTLVTSVMNKFYKFDNKKINNRSLNDLENIFKIPENIIVDSMIGKVRDPKSAIDIVTYVSANNDQLLFNALAFSSGGPGSALSKSGKMAGFEERQIFPDHIGQLDLVCTSASNPGGVGQLVPTANVDLKKKVFIIPTSLKKK